MPPSATASTTPAPVCLDQAPRRSPNDDTPLHPGCHILWRQEPAWLHACDHATDINMPIQSLPNARIRNAHGQGDLPSSTDAG